MEQNKPIPGVGLLESYQLDSLGAPFRVILKNSVTRSIDLETGKVSIEYPDPVGLLMAVVQVRVLDPRRLTGDDLSYVRRALGIKAVKIAEFLDMSPEHYSRCEAGARALSAGAEKQFRLLSYLTSLYNCREQLLEQIGSSEELPEPVSEKSKKKAERFIQIFLSMKIEASVRLVGDDQPSIEYVFYRRDDECDAMEDCDEDVEGYWKEAS